MATESESLASLNPGDRKLVDRFTATRPSVADRMAVGKTLRRKIPRASLAEYKPSPKRGDPVAILEAQAKTRLPELIPVRYARMLASPFAFLRGCAAVMAQDLAPSPVTDIQVQVCGDMHVSNVGVFASAERNLEFGINDFDETIPGPWEWDLKRLAASAVVGGQFLGDDLKSCESFSRSVVSSYRKHIHEYAHMGYLATWYATIREKDLFKAVSPKLRDRLREGLNKAKRRSHLQVLEKMTDLVDNKERIVEDAPFVVRETKTQNGMPVRKALGFFLHEYLASLSPDRRELISRYRVLDGARKVVGVGSVGTRCWIVLMQGSTEGDPLFLQVKEAQASVLSPYVNTPSFDNHGFRVVSGQRLIQGSPDILLGWGKVDGIHYYVRQLRDMKGGYEFDPKECTPEGFQEHCELCGWALALAHAKSGDAAMIAGYVGKSDELDEALTKFALAYSDQNDRDYAELKKAARTHRITVSKVA
ncbi:MAG: DUF2252 domain-containing protein [Terriglobales bacterium]